MTAQLRESYAGLERKVELRTAELTEALDYQTAISSVLRVISESPTDVTPVFEVILESATRLFGEPIAAVARYDGEQVHLVATRNWPAEAIEDARRLYPAPPNPQMMTGRVILSGTVQTIEDTLDDPGYDHQAAGVGHWRRMVGAPLLQDGAPVGAIVVAWPDPGKTPGRQADLLKTFADQAVIAIENVRLINETKEALHKVEQRTSELTESLDKQTAISEILRVISSSPTDTQPVFEAIVKSCRRLFQGRTVVLHRARKGIVETIAIAQEETLAEDAGRPPDRWPLDRGSAMGMCILDARVLNIADTQVAMAELPRLKDLAVALGFGSGLFVPMVRGGRAQFGLAVMRVARGAFTEPEVALAQTFADQAVIAIENVRLFNETREALRKVEERTAELSEALDYQTAISGVLRVISQSPTDVTPVFEAILESASRLFGSPTAAVFRYDEHLVHLAATRNWPARPMT